jgi:hypothetical protein
LAAPVGPLPRLPCSAYTARIFHNHFDGSGTSFDVSRFQLDARPRSATIPYHRVGNEMTSPYPIIDVTGWAIDRVEQMGSKKKVRLFHPNGRRWLFKENRPGAGEDWSEKIAAEIAALSGEFPRSSVQSGEVKSDAVPSRGTPGKAEGNQGFAGGNDVSWRGGRVVECAGFENRSARKGSGSSNLPLSVRGMQQAAIHPVP